MTIDTSRPRLRALAALFAVAALAVAGCGSTAASASATAPVSLPPTASPVPTPAESASTPADASQWLATELTDVTTGEKLSLETLPDLVLIQGMVRSNAACKSQAAEIKKLRQAWAGEGLTVVSLDLDAGDDAAALKAFAVAAGYDWHFAVAPADMVSALGELYGPQYVDPSTSPMWLVTLGKNVVALPPGVKSADDLQATITSSTGV